MGYVEQEGLIEGFLRLHEGACNLIRESPHVVRDPRRLVLREDRGGLRGREGSRNALLSRERRRGREVGCLVGHAIA